MNRSHHMHTKRVTPRAIGRILAICLLVGTLLTVTACGSKSPAPDPAEDGVLRVVATSFAGFDYARNLTKDAPEGTVEVSLLGKPGQDMHGFEPTAADILTIGKADILVSVGGVSEVWLEAALKSSKNPSVNVVSMMDICEGIPSAPTEGMDTDHDHDHDHEHHHEHPAGAADEHLWLSVGNAEKIAAAIGEALVKADPAHKDLWEKNSAAYGAELAALKQDYADMVAGAARKTVVIADRYPFVYLMHELGLECFAAFPGCSSETSASFATQTFLIEKTKELKLPYIFQIDGSDGKVAETVAREAGAEVLSLNSLQVVSDLNETYVGAMRDNLEALRRALS